MIFIVILVVIICLIAIKYLRINAKELSRDSFKEAAYAHAEKLKYKDPIINCDYCGTKIDTSKEKSCPNCGAAFSLDDEWLKRREIDLASLEKEADAYAEIKLKEAKRKSFEKTRKLRMGIATLSFILVIIVGTIILHINDNEYRSSEKLNVYSYENYMKEDYEIYGSNILLDKEGITVKIKGIYQNLEFGTGDYKIEYEVSNNTGKDVDIAFNLAGVNGHSKDSGMGFFYGHFKKNKTVTVYEEVYNLKETGIKYLIYNDLSIYDGESYIYESYDFVTINTTSTAKLVPDVPDGELVYDDNNVQVYSEGKKDDCYMLCIVNDSDNDYLITSSDIRINGEEFDSSSIYKEALPRHHVLYGSIYAYDEKYNSVKSNDNLELSISFNCIKNPTVDFSTGYIKIN